MSGNRFDRRSDSTEFLSKGGSLASISEFSIYGMHIFPIYINAK